MSLVQTLTRNLQQCQWVETAVRISANPHFWKLGIWYIFFFSFFNKKKYNSFYKVIRVSRTIGQNGKDNPESFKGECTFMHIWRSDSYSDRKHFFYQKNIYNSSVAYFFLAFFLFLCPFLQEKKNICENSNWTGFRCQN